MCVLSAFCSSLLPFLPAFVLLGDLGVSLILVILLDLFLEVALKLTFQSPQLVAFFVFCPEFLVVICGRGCPALSQSAQMLPFQKYSLLFFSI